MGIIRVIEFASEKPSVFHLLCSCRFIALVKLEQKLADNPNKKLLMEAIAKKRLGQFDSFLDHLHTEMIITGRHPCQDYFVHLHLHLCLHLHFNLCIRTLSVDS